MKITIKKLKPLDEVIKSHPEWIEESPGQWENDILDQYINSEMVSLFGNSRPYEFRFISRKEKISINEWGYTHEGPMNYLYHEDWFQPDIEIKIEDSLFEI